MPSRTAVWALLGGSGVRQRKRQQNLKDLPGLVCQRLRENDYPGGGSKSPLPTPEKGTSPSQVVRVPGGRAKQGNDHSDNGQRPFSASVEGRAEWRGERGKTGAGPSSAGSSCDLESHLASLYECSFSSWELRGRIRPRLSLGKEYSQVGCKWRRPNGGPKYRVSGSSRLETPEAQVKARGPGPGPRAQELPGESRVTRGKTALAGWQGRPGT